MEFVEYKGKTVDDAITEACQALTITSDKLEYEIVEKGSSGILGFGSKLAVIKARKIEEKTDKKVEKEENKVEKKKDKVEEKSSKKEFVLDKNSTVEPAQDPKEFLEKVFNAMNMQVNIDAKQEGNEINIELSGDDMGVLIGKRGQTLDSLQYLTSLVVNKGTIVEDVKLPSKVTATLDDESEVELKLTWDTSAFVANTVGEYKLVGTPILTQGIYNSSDETVTFTLKVIEPPVAEHSELGE